MGRFMKTALNIIESFVLYVFFGLVPVVVIFLATVIIGSVFLGTKGLGPWVLWSFLPAILIDVLFLKKWTKNAYQMNAKIIGGLYAFYSICALGFFMGIPIGCIFLGVLAGVYAGRRVSLAGNNRISNRDYFRKVAVFSSAVMVLICALITLWAIAGKMIGYRVEVPIAFTLTAPVFWAVVFIGGAFLVLLQYWLTSTAAKVTLNLSN